MEREYWHGAPCASLERCSCAMISILRYRSYGGIPLVIDRWCVWMSDGAPPIHSRECLTLISLVGGCRHNGGRANESQTPVSYQHHQSTHDV